MKNFPVKVDGKEFWISRSVAVVGLIFTLKEDKLALLAVKRGKGCPDEIGKWCLPCGYVDYDETLEEACIREVKEETGLSIKKNQFHFIGYDDSPKSNKQNITMHYRLFSETLINEKLTTKYSEPYEIDDVKWFTAEEAEKTDWAFNHKYIIKDNLLHF